MSVNVKTFILLEIGNSASSSLEGIALLDNTEQSKAENAKFILDKYYEILKLRAAQSLALFLVYGLALRESREFLDGGSILSMVIPIAAWFLDMTARRHYGAPLAYAALRQEHVAKRVATEGKEDFSIGEIILDFKLRHQKTLVEIFAESLSEVDRRRRFSVWYTKKDQLIPLAVFFTFFVIAVLFHRVR